MVQILDSINHFVWGIPALLLTIGVGITLTVRAGFVQIRLFPKALRSFVGQMRIAEPTTERTTAYQALCTALAATVGTGNIAGVAGAIAIGGPGAIFWMWICGLLGMATKFGEATLAVACRVYNKKGEPVGGPMYMIRNAMDRRWHFLAYAYCIFGVVAAFGIGNAAQMNAVLDSVESVISAFRGSCSETVRILTGILLAGVVTVVLVGGARRIGSVAERLVPVAAAFYILLCAGVLLVRIREIPCAFAQIISGAFTPRAVTGGVISSVFTALRVGAARGVFTNEAGMGTAAIAHASADVDHPVQQGMMGIIEVFLDTIVICTLTALVILCSGISVPYGKDVGMTLTVAAFSNVYGSWISIPLGIAVSCFAVATILGWGMYGVRCAQFLFGERVWTGFTFAQAAVLLFSVFFDTQTIWLISETVNGLMAIPSLIVLAYLTPKLSSLLKDYQKKLGRKSANGGTYENFNQCKPLRTVADAEVSSSCCKS